MLGNQCSPYQPVTGKVYARGSNSYRLQLHGVFENSALQMKSCSDPFNKIMMKKLR